MTLEECLAKQQKVNDVILDSLKNHKVSPEEMKAMISGLSNADPTQFVTSQQKILQDIVTSEEMVRLNYELAKDVATLSFEDYEKYLRASFDMQGELSLKMNEVRQASFSEALQSSLLYRVGHLFGGGQDN